MSILSLLIDKVANNTLTGPTSTTYNHSLATTPDLTLVNLKSVGAATAYPALCAIGANASIATVAVMAASTGTAGAVNFDVWDIFFHSMIR